MKPVVYPSDWLMRDERPPLSQFGRRLLAEGDSWFTIGTLNLPEASNILFKLELTVTTAIVNCAYPGDTLQHMVDNVNDPYFDRLLCRKRFSSYWEAILISAGGNDLIDATQVGPLDRNGIRVPIDQRLLLTPDEASQNLSATGPDRYISEGGWHRLAKYLQTNFRELTQRRDKGPSKGRPLFTHTYSIPTIRPSGTLGNPRGWLYPALAAFDIPDASRQGVTSALFGRLRMLLLGLDQASGKPEALPNMHVFDSAGLTDVVAAEPGSQGLSNDWINEIHLSPNGYRKLGVAFGPWIEKVLSQYP